MKFRTGFVSNSSSASFIIGDIQDSLFFKAIQAVEDINIPPIKEVAREMLIVSKRKSIIKWLDKIPDNVKMITFSSCNYETQILSNDSCIIIFTCNNEQTEWEQAFTSIKNKYGLGWEYYPDEVADEIKNKFYYRYEEIEFKDLDEEYPVYSLFSFKDIAINLGPAAYLNRKGVVIYENESRICIK
jgi:hypothetical protein